VRNNDEYLIFISVQNLVRTNIVLSDVTAITIIWPLWNTHGKHDVIHKTESTQHPSQHRRGQHARSLVKFGRMVSEICERTYRQTYSSQYSASLLGRRTNLQPLVQQIYNKSNQWSLSISGVDWNCRTGHWRTRRKTGRGKHRRTGHWRRIWTVLVSLVCLQKPSHMPKRGL